MLNGYNNVLVTGGVGFIGRELVRRLLGVGKKVIVFDSLATSERSAIPSGVTFIHGDIRNPQDLNAAFQGVDLVFHAAANANGSLSVHDPIYDFEVNAQGTYNVLEAARSAKVKRFVYISSAAVYGKPVL